MCNLLRPLCPLFVLAMLFPRAGMAHVFENIESLSITNYTSYIIASDASNPNPGYNRDAIMLSASIRYLTTNSVQTNYHYQLAFRLLDSQGNAMALATGPGQTNTTFYTNDSITLPFGPPLP